MSSQLDPTLWLAMSTDAVGKKEGAKMISWRKAYNVRNPVITR